MKLGPIAIQVIPVDFKARLIDGRTIGCARFVLSEMGPDRNLTIPLDRIYPSVHAPMFREDGSHISSIVVCKQEDPALTWFLVFHELLHAACWIFHLPPGFHRWIDKLVRNQVLDTPCPPK